MKKLLNTNTVDLATQLWLVTPGLLCNNLETFKCFAACYDLALCVKNSKTFAPVGKK